MSESKYSAYVILDGVIDIPSSIFKGILSTELDAQEAVNRLRSWKGHDNATWIYMPRYTSAGDLTNAVLKEERRKAYESIPPHVRELLNIKEPLS